MTQSKLDLVQALALLQKPATFVLSEQGEDSAQFLSEAAIAGINAARCTGCASLHVRYTIYYTLKSEVDRKLNVTIKLLRRLLDVHESFPGEFAVEVKHPPLTYSGEEPGFDDEVCVDDMVFSNIIIVCTDHPSQRGYVPKPAPEPQAKPAEESE